MVFSFRIFTTIQIWDLRKKIFFTYKKTQKKSRFAAPFLLSFFWKFAFFNIFLFKLFIKIGDNTVFSDDVSRNDEGNIKEISYEIRKKALLEDGSQAPMLYLQYRSKALDRIIEISGEISAGSECRLYYETPGGYDEGIERTYNENYHIAIK